MARILDVIEYADTASDEIVHRVPERGSGDFRIGSQLIVREGQAAVFMRDGKALDTFGPGRHTITTANIPLLANLVNMVFSGNTPFTAEVYFVSTRDFIDQRWGTPEPITLRDEVLRMVRIRAHGTYNMQVADPQLFVGQVMGTRGYMSTQDVSNYLRSMIITRITDLLGENMRTVLDLPAMYDEVAAATRVRVRDDFASLGLLLNAAIHPVGEPHRRDQQGHRRGGLDGRHRRHGRLPEVQGGPRRGRRGHQRGRRRGRHSDGHGPGHRPGHGQRDLEQPGRPAAAGRAGPVGRGGRR